MVKKDMHVTCRCGERFDLAEAPWCKCKNKFGVSTKMCPNGHCICHKLDDKKCWRPATVKEIGFGFGSMLKEEFGGVKE